jgi:hypothetical protein
VDSTTKSLSRFFRCPAYDQVFFAMRWSNRRRGKIKGPGITVTHSFRSDKFNEVNEANEVLSDPKKRKKYDQLGQDWKHHQEAGPRRGRRHAALRGEDLNAEIRSCIPHYKERIKA